MKCIVKKEFLCLLALIITVNISGCGNDVVFENKYETFETTEKYGLGVESQSETQSFFAEQLCVGGNEDVLDETVTEGISEAAGLFDLQERQIEYAKNIHEKLYPASTTKILTAYVALKYGDLQQETTVSAEALVLEPGSTLCKVLEGDTITLEQLLYGLMLCSGTDAANVIAEMISGSVEEFAELMNQEALKLGATNSHFVNPHGLHDEQHYTTVYDMYLIFSAALENETFREIMSTGYYEVSFKDKNGEPVEKEWFTTNRYLNGEQAAPDGVTVVGGKTGTTGSAGYCLVLYSENSEGNPYISIVYKADTRNNLYYQMTELLGKL